LSVFRFSFELEYFIPTVYNLSSFDIVCYIVKFIKIMMADIESKRQGLNMGKERVIEGTVLSVDRVSFSDGGRMLLEDIAFTLNAGDKVALVGPNGAGKTTLVHIIKGDIEPDIGSLQLRHGSVIGYLPQTIHEIDLPRDGFVGNFIKSSRGLPEMERYLEKTALKMADEPKDRTLLNQYGDLQEEYERRGGYTADHEILRLLSGLGLKNVQLDTQINHLSGGQKTRLFLARVLFGEPDLLLLDEPTNHLDRPVLEWLANYLIGFRGAVLVVSHDKDFLDKTVTRIVRLNEYDGRAEIITGNYSESLELIEVLKMEAEKQRRLQEKEMQRLFKTINLWRQRGKRAAIASRLEKKVDEIRESLVELPKRDRRMGFRIEVKEQSHKEVLKLENLGKSYGSHEVVRNVSLSVQRGERVAVLGPNGAGKTTLLKMIVGEIRPDKGAVHLGGKVNLGYYAQEQEGLNLENTVHEEMRSVSADRREQDIRAFLGRFGLTGDLFYRSVATLSPGERTKLALAKIMISGCNTLVLDEPTNHLDIPSKERLAEVLEAYEGTVIITSHDSDLLEIMNLDKVLIMPEEKIEH